VVKYAGKCACCGAPIAAGELADYYPIGTIAGVNEGRVAHIGGLDGNSPRCAAEIRQKHDRDYADVDRAYEDQCAEICGR
jgi:hypothetical protein